jgi:hypothetical protein
MPCDTEALAGEIAAVALRERAATGRPCRLRQSAVVGAFLTALVDGRSQTAAARHAGLSEAIVRRWRQLGSADGATGAYVLFARAVQVARAARAPAAPEPVPADPLPCPAPVIDPPAPSSPVPAHLVDRWQRVLAQAAQATDLDARVIREAVGADMRAHGVAELPAAPASRLMLPANLPWPEVQRRYLAWRAAQGLPGLTEYQLERELPRWYHAHVTS